jgi:DNA repair and recombination protein RAD52
MNKKILQEPLNIKNIKRRKEGYGQVGYITAKHAISEANRAFNFDGWSSETLEMKMVQTEQKQKQKKEESDPTIMLNYVGYTCKVKITVVDKSSLEEISREGYGFGQGIDKDLGKAHESATKEAESDAIKRALRTFGDIFGLALYDEQTSFITNEDESQYQVITEEQRINAYKQLKLTRLTVEDICTHFLVEDLGDIRGRDYANLIKLIESKQYKTYSKQTEEDKIRYINEFETQLRIMGQLSDDFLKWVGIDIEKESEKMNAISKYLRDTDMLQDQIQNFIEYKSNEN